jgi:hypothetical protein
MRRLAHLARAFTQGTMRDMDSQNLFLPIGCLDKLLHKAPQENSIRFPYLSLKLTGSNLKIISLPALFSISICQDRSKRDLSPKKVHTLFKKVQYLEIFFLIQ